MIKLITTNITRIQCWNQSYINLEEEARHCQTSGCVQRILYSFLGVDNVKFNGKPLNRVWHLHFSVLWTITFSRPKCAQNRGSHWSPNGSGVEGSYILPPEVLRSEHQHRQGDPLWRPVAGIGILTMGLCNRVSTYSSVSVVFESSIG